MPGDLGGERDGGGRCLRAFVGLDLASGRPLETLARAVPQPPEDLLLDLLPLLRGMTWLGPVAVRVLLVQVGRAALVIGPEGREGERGLRR